MYIYMCVRIYVCVIVNIYICICLYMCVCNNIHNSVGCQNHTPRFCCRPKAI